MRGGIANAMRASGRFFLRTGTNAEYYLLKSGYWQYID